MNRQLAGLSEGIGFAFSPPAIPGVGTAGGVTFLLQDRAGRDIAYLAGNVKTFMEAVRQRRQDASTKLGRATRWR